MWRGHGLEGGSHAGGAQTPEGVGLASPTEARKREGTREPGILSPKPLPAPAPHTTSCSAVPGRPGEAVPSSCMFRVHRPEFLSVTHPSPHRGARPAPPLGPSSKCLRSSLCPSQPRLWMGRRWGGEAGSHLPTGVLVNLAQLSGALWDGKCWEEEQMALCPPGTSLPFLRLPKGAPPHRPISPLSGAAMGPLASSWQPWAPQLGHPHLAPRPTSHPVAT